MLKLCFDVWWQRLPVSRLRDLRPAKDNAACHSPLQKPHPLTTSILKRLGVAEPVFFGSLMQTSGQTCSTNIGQFRGSHRCLARATSLRHSEAIAGNGCTASPQGGKSRGWTKTLERGRSGHGQMLRYRPTPLKQSSSDKTRASM